MTEVQERNPILDAVNEYDSKPLYSHIGHRPYERSPEILKDIQDEMDGKDKNIRLNIKTPTIHNFAAGYSIELPGLGWQNIDVAVGFGLRPGQVSIICGEPGVCKSLFSLNIAMAAESQGFKWSLLPLEDYGAKWAMKLLAIKENNWRVLVRPEDDERETVESLAKYKMDVVERNEDWLNKILECNICENPLLVPTGREERNGKFRATYSSVDWDMLLDRLEDIMPQNGLYIIDNISQVTFSPDGKNDFAFQAKFMQQLTPLAHRKNCHVMLVSHTAKTAQGNNSTNIVQGSAMFGRLAHVVIGLEKHKPPETSVWENDEATEIKHDTTVHIIKARDGISGTKIAVNISNTGPTFYDCGKIIRKQPRRK